MERFSGGAELSATLIEAPDFLADDPYLSVVLSKIKIDRASGIEVSLEEINPRIPFFNRLMIQWALRGGRRALFAAFGLHKTCCQLEIMRLIGKYRPTWLRLIVLPLGVRQEFASDAESFFQEEYSVKLQFAQDDELITDPSVIYLTNYETVRENKLDMSRIGAISLDEADCLRSFGSQTFSEFLFGAVQETIMRFVNTATPSPNDYHELLAYAHFLGVMEIGEARTRFFQRDSEQADNLTLYPHMEEAFWQWVNSWALYVLSPSDLKQSWPFEDDSDWDLGYTLPDLDLRFHEVPSDHRETSSKPNRVGQMRLLREEAVGVQQASAEKKSSLAARIAKLLELRSEDPDAHRIIWHDLEVERLAIESAIPSVVSVYGNQKPADQEWAILGFRAGTVQELAAKPVMLGGGCNFQRHCNWAIFLGIGFKFRDFIQAIHRLQRFGQSKTVRIDLIYSELERPVLEALLRKWEKHKIAVARMTAIVREFGLSGANLAAPLVQRIGVDREEASGKMWLSVKYDTVYENRSMESDSVGQILTSPPFSNQYRYTVNYCDFGHNLGIKEFFRQMDHLTPELYRILMPGRVACIHVKDRRKPGEMTGHSYQTVDPFHAFTITHFMEHGFHYMGMVTVVTDVVKENNDNNYCLSYSQQLKDGSRMGFGMPEYVLVFRKPPTNTQKGYADCPVAKAEGEYPLSQWQIDAHGYWRSKGDRFLTPEDLVGHRWKKIIREYRHHSATTVYDFALDCAMAEALDQAGILPRDFMLLQPQSWHPDVWTDVTRMRTLNMHQEKNGREKHLCPLQEDIVKRLITRYSNPGDVVYDPFGGIGTVPYWAVKLGRYGRATELNGGYWHDSCIYLREAENGSPAPSLEGVDWDAPETEGVAA